MEQVQVQEGGQRAARITSPSAAEPELSELENPMAFAASESGVCYVCAAHRPHLLYRVTDVAETLSISRAKVYELIAAGSLPSVRLDGCRRIRHQDLLQFISRLGSVA